MKYHFKGLLFDLDGTLIDSFDAITLALNATLEEFGLKKKTREEVQALTGSNEDNISSLFGKHWPDAHNRFLEIHDAHYLESMRTIKGAEDFLIFSSSRSIPCAIVTNKGQHRAEKQVQKLGWQHYFHTITGRQESLPPKPSPEPVFKTCKLMKLPPRYCCYFGDGLSDMQAGSDAGCYCVGICTSFSKKQMQDQGASHCVASLDEGLEWLKKTLN